MDLLDVLRTLTLLTRLLLAAALVALVWGKAARLGVTRWRAWLTVAIAFTVVAVDNAVLEALAAAARGLPEDAALEQIRRSFYNATYLLHAVLSAAVPAVLMALAGIGRVRVVGLVAAWAAVVIGALAAGAGAVESWDKLLNTTRLLSFIAIPAYLGFLGLMLLGHLPGLDRYLGWFISVRALFVILVPIQEVFFQSVGRVAASQLWHLSQFLQFATAAIHLGIVALVLRSVSGAGAAPGVAGAAAVPRAGTGA